MLKVIRENYPTLPVIILSMFPEDQYAVRAMKAGANGYIAISNAFVELISTVREVVRGENDKNLIN